MIRLIRMTQDTTSTNEGSTPARFALHALKFGVIAGTIGGAWAIADYALGFQTERPEIGRWTFLASMVIPIAATILGMMSWRNNALGGRIRFVQAFGMALAIGLGYALCLGGASWLQAARISPDILERKLEQRAVFQAQQPGANPEEIARQIEADRQAATPRAYGQFVFSITLMQAFFIGLIASITVPKKRPGLD